MYSCAQNCASFYLYLKDMGIWMQRPVENLSGGVPAWLCVWGKVQICIWPKWYHCHSLSVASVKSGLVLPFWYRITRVLPDRVQRAVKQMCVCVCGPTWFCKRKTELSILSLGGATGVINLFSVELTDVFRTKQCWSVPKIMQIGSEWRFKDIGSQAYWPTFFAHPVCWCLVVIQYNVLVVGSVYTRNVVV